VLTEVKEQDRGVAYLRKVIEGACTTPLLLVGDEGTGRKFSVKEAVKEAFSEGDPKSNQCMQVDKGIHPDFILLASEDDKAIGIDSVREAIAFSYQYPAVARKRYVLIDGADQLTNAAANALLKTLEEPPKVTQFFLLTQSKESVIPTIVSRCGEVRYNRLSESFIISALSQFTDDPRKAHVYARLSEGSIGRAIKYLGSNRLGLRDRVVNVLRSSLTGDLSSMFSGVDGLEKELRLALRFLEHVLFDLIMLNYSSTTLTNVDIVEDMRQLSQQIGLKKAVLLQNSLQQVIRRSHTKINLSFHVKACLATAFVTG